MKKMKFRALAIFAAAVMAMSFASCSINFNTGSSADGGVSTESSSESISGDSQESFSESVSIDSEESSSESASSFSGLKAYRSMQEYIESEEVADAIEGLADTFEQQGLSISVGAEGDCMIYEYKYVDQVEVTEESAQALSDSLDSMSDTIQTSLETIALIVEAENPSIRYVYLNADGTEITSREFYLEQ